MNTKLKTKDLTLMGLMTAFISVSAQIAIPLGMVPFTLQTTLILMAGLILGSRRGLITCIIYMLVGAIGIPVFAGFSGGLDTIFLQTGGFIMSFPLMAYVAGKFSELSNKMYMHYIGSLLGVVLNFIVGCAYFMYVTEMDLMASLSYTVLPFIFTSLIQIVIAVTFSKKIKLLINI